MDVDGLDTLGYQLVNPTNGKRLPELVQSRWAYTALDAYEQPKNKLRDPLPNLTPGHEAI